MRINKERSIAVLRSLIEINDYRIEGYKKALTETEVPDLMRLFSHCILTSQKCKAELANEIRNITGKPIGHNKSGWFFKVLMNFKTATPVNDNQIVLDEMYNRGPGSVIETYNEVFRNSLNDITESQQVMLNAQRTQLRTDHYRIMHLNHRVQIQS